MQRGPIAIRSPSVCALFCVLAPPSNYPAFAVHWLIDARILYAFTVRLITRRCHAFHREACEGDLHAHRTHERGESSLAHAHRRVRSAHRLVGRRDAILCSLAE